MTLHFFSASKLADDLVNERLSTKDFAYYILAGIIFNTIAAYSTLIGGNAGRGWIGVYESVLLIVTTIYGVSRCYNASAGTRDKFFIADFVCLSLPVGVTTSLIVWGSYWGSWEIYRYVVLSTSFGSERTVKLITSLNEDLPWITTLLAVVLSNIVFYLRIAGHIKRMRALRQRT